jgi:hypothetical protein
MTARSCVLDVARQRREVDDGVIDEALEAVLKGASK